MSASPSKRNDVVGGVDVGTDGVHSMTGRNSTIVEDLAAVVVPMLDGAADPVGAELTVGLDPPTVDVLVGDIVAGALATLPSCPHE